MGRVYFNAKNETVHIDTSKGNDENRIQMKMNYPASGKKIEINDQLNKKRSESMNEMMSLLFMSHLKCNCDYCFENGGGGNKLIQDQQSASKLKGTSTVLYQDKQRDVACENCNDLFDIRWYRPQ